MLIIIRPCGVAAPAGQLLTFLMRLTDAVVADITVEPVRAARAEVPRAPGHLAILTENQPNLTFYGSLLNHPGDKNTSPV